VRVCIGVAAVLAACLLTTLSGVKAASARPQAREFYLSVRVHQCLISGPTTTRKLLPIVPCSDPAHRFEVYAIGHGGWGTTPPSQSTALAVARSVCLGAFQRLTGHPLAATLGWNAFWPDPGAESRRYLDKIICSLRTWPHLAPLGAGWHVH
jgi:hypothetical protein